MIIAPFFEWIYERMKYKKCFFTLFVESVLPNFSCSFSSVLSWSIKHVCVHTQGASLHADFADSRNKFRGPSVREEKVIFLPPQFHTEALN